MGGVSWRQSAAIRVALTLWIEEEDVCLDFDVRLPRETVAAVRESKRARANAESGRELAARKTEHAAIELVERASLGVRDAADLLGLSHQRVQQILEASRT